MTGIRKQAQADIANGVLLGRETIKALLSVPTTQEAVMIRNDPDVRNAIREYLDCPSLEHAVEMIQVIFNAR